MKTNFFYRDLTGTMEDPLFSPILITLNPGDNGGRNFAHKGQEFLYVLEGILTVLINDEESILHPFDSIFLDSSFPHYWLNNKMHPIKFLCISDTEYSYTYNLVLVNRTFQINFKNLICVTNRPN